MEVIAKTHAVTVTTLPLVTEMMERFRMGVKEVIEEVIVNSVSDSKHFKDV